MDIDIKLTPQSGELGPQHNRHGQTGTREVVTELEIGRSTFVTLRVRTVQYGVYKGQTAALIVLDFILRSPAGPKRIRHFNVKVTFRNKNYRRDKFAPRVLFLMPEDEIGSMIAAEHSSDEINSIAEIHGWKSGSEGQTDNVMVWDCPEPTGSGRRIAHRCNGVIIVAYECSESFQADVNLYVDCGMRAATRKIFEYIPLFGSIGKDDPLLFDPSKPFGLQYHGVEDLSNIDPHDLIYASRYEAEQTMIRAASQPRPPREDKNQSKEMLTGMTIRVTNIPSNFSTTNVQLILDSSAPGSIVVCSLAPDIASSGQEPPQVATITSSTISEALSHLHSSYVKRVYYEDNNIGKGHVLLDRAFLGMTVLYDPDVEHPGSCLLE